MLFSMVLSLQLLPPVPVLLLLRRFEPASGVVVIVIPQANWLHGDSHSYSHQLRAAEVSSFLRLEKHKSTQ